MGNLILFITFVLLNIICLLINVLNIKYLAKENHSIVIILKMVIFVNIIVIITLFVFIKHFI